MNTIDSWDSNFMITFIVILVFVAGWFGFYVVGCDADKNQTIMILESQGYKDVKITGNNIFSCGKGDVSSASFTAKGENETTVKGVVCCGLVKGCTVRIINVHHNSY